MTTPERLLVVVAHPDDESFGCGSIIALATAAGVETVVLCATRGEAGSPADGTAVGAGGLGAVREAELRAAASVLGVSAVRVLDWRDSGMDGDPGPGTLAGADHDDVATAVVAVIDEVRPTVLVTLDASDGHRDHAAIRDATLAAVHRASAAPHRVYLHCLPRRLMRAWVEVLRAEDPGSDYLAIGELGAPDEVITAVIDTAAVLAVRERAMAAHGSQTSPFAVMPPEVRRAFLTSDSLTRVSPPPSGPRETALFRTDQPPRGSS